MCTTISLVPKAMPRLKLCMKLSACLRIGTVAQSTEPFVRRPASNETLPNNAPLLRTHRRIRVVGQGVGLPDETVFEIMIWQTDARTRELIKRHHAPVTDGARETAGRGDTMRV